MTESQAKKGIEIRLKKYYSIEHEVLSKNHQKLGSQSILDIMK